MGGSFLHRSEIRGARSAGRRWSGSAWWLTELGGGLDGTPIVETCLKNPCGVYVCRATKVVCVNG